MTLRGPDQAGAAGAAQALGLSAFVSPAFSALTVICERESDTQDPAIWHRVAKDLSLKLTCPALAVLNHDDDILMYALYRSGELMDEYNSYPGYWEETDEGSVPVGGDARKLCDLFGMSGDVEKVGHVLRSSNEDDGEFVFAMDRHAALAEALHWRDVPFQQGFGYMAKGGAPAGWRRVG